MKQRVGLWALAGFAMASFWVIYGMATGPAHNLGQATIIAVTAPASFLGRAVPLAYYWFVLLNAAVYALVGLAIELLRRPLRSALSS